MSRNGLPPVVVGNEFIVRPRPRVEAPVEAAQPKLVLPIVPVMAAAHAEFIPVAVLPAKQSPFQAALDLAHRHSLVTFALLFLLVGVAGIKVAGSYWTAHILATEKAAVSVKAPAHTIAGLNITVPSGQLASKLQSITAQPASLTVGDQTVAVSPDSIKSWLQITASRDKTQDYIRIKSDAMTASLNDMANKFVKAPIDQVTATYADGSSSVIVGGRNGSKLTDPGGLKTQATAVAKTVMDAKGLQFNAPLQTVAFAAVTPSAFSRLIEVNVSTHQMYLYQNGSLWHQYAISAGAPATPTPLGEFHIYSKLPVQTMTGFNADGSRYVQPNVPWINYFLPGGYAVHGNYWRPASVFGFVNTSHGCVSLPVAQAKEVYDWAPLGTTVITHA